MIYALKQLTSEINLVDVDFLLTLRPHTLNMNHGSLFTVSLISEFSSVFHPSSLDKKELINH